MVFLAGDAQFGQHQAHHPFQEIGVAPEDMKGLVEDQPLVRRLTSTACKVQ